LEYSHHISSGNSYSSHKGHKVTLLADPVPSPVRIMTASPTIIEPASIIFSNTLEINDLIEARGLAQPSFNFDAPKGSVIPPDNHELEAARGALIDATMQLHDLILGPKEHLMSFSV
jgi:hypothetical protein